MTQFYSEEDYIFWCGAISYLMLSVDIPPSIFDNQQQYMWKMGFDYAKTMYAKNKNYNLWL